MKTADTVVIGGGIIGTMIASELAQSGMKRVMLLEKLEIGSGATGQSGGILRVYHPDPVLSDLALESFPVFKRFQETLGEAGRMTQTGLIYLESQENFDGLVRESKRLEARGAELILLSKREGEQRFPQFNWEGLGGAVYESGAGYVDPLLMSKAMAKKALQQGVQLCEGVEVYRILENQGVTTGVDTSIGIINCPLVVICTGAWSQALLSQYILPETIRSKVIQFQLVQVKNSPKIGFIDSTTDLYSRPYGKGLTLIGLPINKWDIKPDERESIDVEHHERVMHQASLRLMEWSCTRFFGGRRSFDAYTANGRGLVTELPGLAGTVVATGFSGSGVKIAPAIVLQTKDWVLART